jgi:hypothetical protein
MGSRTRGGAGGAGSAGQWTRRRRRTVDEIEPRRRPGVAGACTSAAPGFRRDHLTGNSRGSVLERDIPDQDLACGFYLLNTNNAKQPEDDRKMLEEGKAAAFFDPWKRRIESLERGDTVFLYRSGEGIVAWGRASGRLERRAYHGDPEHDDEEYAMALLDFRRTPEPLPAWVIKAIGGRGISFRRTMTSVPEEAGRRLVEHLQSLD